MVKQIATKPRRKDRIILVKKSCGCELNAVIILKNFLMDYNTGL